MELIVCSDVQFDRRELLLSRNKTASCNYRQAQARKRGYVIALVGRSHLGPLYLHFEAARLVGIDSGLLRNP